MRHIVEEVEAGAAGTEQHGVAASGEGCRRPDAVRHVVRVGNGNAVFGSEGIKGLVKLGVVSPEEDDGAAFPGNEVEESGVIVALVRAPTAEYTAPWTLLAGP